MEMQKYVALETFAEVDEHAIRAAVYPSMLPAELDAGLLAELGFAELEYDPVPELAPGEALAPGDVRREGERVIQGWAVVPAPEPDWPGLIAARRYIAEIAGVDVGGMHVDTDDRSKLLINGAALEAMLDPAYVMQWKTSAGFVELQAEQVLAVARSVRAHVQRCFDREAELLTELSAGALTPEMLEEGWPG